MQNVAQLTDLLARHGVRLVLQGHMHENERRRVGGVEYVSSISIGGSWFQAEGGFERGVDGVPRGYRIVSVDGDRVTHRYQSSCESRVAGQAEFVGLDRPLVAAPNTPFVLNCYDAPHGAVAEARIDNGRWQPMPAFDAMNRRVGLKMPHRFRLVADTTALTPGEHTIATRVRWPGTAVEHQQAFTIAAENRKP